MKKEYLIICLLCLMSGSAWSQQAAPVYNEDGMEPLEITIGDVGPQSLGQYVVLRNMADFYMNSIWDFDGGACYCYFDEPPFLPAVLCWGYDFYGTVEFRTDGYFDYYCLHVSGIRMHTERQATVDVTRFSSVYALFDGFLLEYFDLMCRITKPITVIFQCGDYLYARDREGQNALIVGGIDGNFVNGDMLVDGIVRPSLDYGPQAMTVADPSSFRLIGNAPIEPVSMTVDQVTTSMVHKYCIFKDAVIRTDDGSMSLCDMSGNMPLLNKFDVSLTPSDAVTPSDVNGDNEVSIADVTKLISMLLSGCYEQQWISDPDGETLDVIAILGKVNGAMVAYPCEVIHHGSHSITRGDINEDGEVNIGDVNLLIDQLLGKR